MAEVQNVYVAKPAQSPSSPVSKSGCKSSARYQTPRLPSERGSSYSYDLPWIGLAAETGTSQSNPQICGAKCQNRGNSPSGDVANAPLLEEITNASVVDDHESLPGDINRRPSGNDPLSPSAPVTSTTPSVVEARSWVQFDYERRPLAIPNQENNSAGTGSTDNEDFDVASSRIDYAEPRQPVFQVLSQPPSHNGVNQPGNAPRVSNFQSIRHSRSQNNPYNLVDDHPYYNAEPLRVDTDPEVPLTTTRDHENSNGEPVNMSAGTQPQSQSRSESQHSNSDTKCWDSVYSYFNQIWGMSCFTWRSKSNN